MKKKKSRIKKWWVAAIAIVLTLVLLIIIDASNQNKETIVSPPAPDFTLQNSNGTAFTLNEYLGGVVVIQFMSVPGCGDNPAPTDDDIAQFKELRTVYNKYCLSNDTDSVTIITIIQHSKCCELNLGSDYYNDIEWFVATEREPYPTVHKYGDYLETEMVTVQGFTVPKMNPQILIIDKDQKIASASDYTTAISLSSKIDSVLEGAGHEQISIFSITPVPVSMYGSMLILGIITCVAPCCIALFVATISYIMTVCMKKTDGVNENIKVSAKRGAVIGMLFTMGMALVFLLIGCLVMYLNIFIQSGIIANTFIAITGLVLIIFGLDNVGAFNRIKTFYHNKVDAFRKMKRDRGDEEAIGPPEKGLIEKLRLRGLKISRRSVNIGAFLLGMLFGIAWAPCALSLIFPVILLLMTQKVTVLTGGLLLFVFGLGHGIPFVPLATVTSAARARFTEKMVKTGNLLIKVFGMIIIVLGVLMILNYFGCDFGVGW